MATFLPKCDTCMTDDASVWCSECEEVICYDCEKQHSRIKLTKKHKTIPIEDYQKLPSSVADIKQECKVHNKIFYFYCLIHSEPCCVSCVSQEHDTCKNLKPLTEVVDGVKSSAAFEDLEDRAKDISELIGNLIKNKQDNKRSLAFQKNRIISEMQNVRKTINIHLDKLEKDLLGKLDNEEKKQCKNIDSLIEKISKMGKHVDQIVNDLKQIKQHASDFQTFFGLHEWNKKIEKDEKDLMSLQSDKILDSADIHIEYSPILMKFETYVKEFGKLEVKSSSSKKNVLKKEKPGQIIVPISNTVDNIKLTSIRSFKTPDGVSSNIFITGIDMFDDGRIVFADNQHLNKRLVIMNREGNFIKNIQLDDRCFDVAVIDKDTVASTLVEKKKIVIVDVNSSRVQRYILSSAECYGIIFSGEQLVVSLPKTIQFVDPSGNSWSTLSTVNKSMYCSVLDEKLYYTSHNSEAVYSTKLNGEVLWKFDCQKYDYPTSITNDASGNIFVVCTESDRLMVLGNDGKTYTILLTKENGLQKPRALHYDRKSSTLCVCTLSGQCFLYKATN
ncbi:uncharacterized protein LOC127720342 isoform X1 [Mytilus californianus]|uniref:uncharacterized protein LOC127720342 isoform X1 n=1 Tax=Mytilus californianus TaxID=6549 RepID=UPI0022472659|nr:uncharacterized protein LOC127720342 isoform X1 [Mytilus californianus]XP_052082882.1 uncharacterized protein LOC127720342 isoform X1 [Mytilus californianus]